MRNETAYDFLIFHKWNYVSIILTVVMIVVSVFCRATRKLALEQAMKTQRGNRAITLLFL
jgi:hypothetical protein